MAVFLSGKRDPLEQFDLSVIGLGLGVDLKVFLEGSFEHIAFGFPTLSDYLVPQFGSGGQPSERTAALILRGHPDNATESGKGHFDGLFGVPGMTRVVESHVSVVQAISNFRGVIENAKSLPTIDGASFSPPQTGVLASDYVRLHRRGGTVQAAHDKIDGLTKLVSQLARKSGLNPHELAKFAGATIDLTDESEAPDSEDLSTPGSAAQLEQQAARLEKRLERLRELAKIQAAAEAAKAAAEAETAAEDARLSDEANQSNRELLAALEHQAKEKQQELTGAQEQHAVTTAAVSAAQASLDDAQKAQPRDMSVVDRLTAALRVAKSAEKTAASAVNVARARSEGANAAFASLLASLPDLTSDAEDTDNEHPQRLVGGGDSTTESRLTHAMAFAKLISDNTAFFEQLFKSNGNGYPTQIASQINWEAGEPHFDAAQSLLSSLASAKNNTRLNAFFVRACRISLSLITEDNRRDQLQVIAKVAAMLDACRPGFFVSATVKQKFIESGFVSGADAAWRDVEAAMPVFQHRVLASLGASPEAPNSPPTGAADGAGASPHRQH
jgi:hypothetical protein